MNKNFMKLFRKFEKIRELGWVESKRKGSTGIGYTFESLLNIQENSLPIPDYKNIEIKTMRILSRKNVHLFNAAPDGDYLNYTERILNKLGYPCKKNKKFKVFMSAVKGKNYSYIGYNKKIKIEIDYINEKINLIAKDINNNDLKLNVSWSFELLKNKINNKIKYLALIKTKKKKENNKELFHYIKIDFYEIKDFETFLKLLEDGIITITFKINVYTEGEKIGMIDNHGTDFSILDNNIELLYNKVDIFQKKTNHK